MAAGLQINIRAALHPYESVTIVSLAGRLLTDDDARSLRDALKSLERNDNKVLLDVTGLAKMRRNDMSRSIGLLVQEIMNAKRDDVEFKILGTQKPMANFLFNNIVTALRSFNPDGAGKTAPFAVASPATSAAGDKTAPARPRQRAEVVERGLDWELGLD